MGYSEKDNNKGTCGHGRKIAEALEILRRPENRLKVVDYSLPYGGGAISLIGIFDCDPERNLGDYQNMSYYLLTGDAEKSSAVIDPGLRDAGWIRDLLGIADCDVIFTHFHLDHWIGYEPFSSCRFYSSPLCKAVLTQMVGAERTGKSIFVEGRLNDYHRRPLPLRAANDAERFLPLRVEISPVTAENPYRNEALALEFFELPFGQTEGTLYGILQTEQIKILFAGDLFININGELKVEPHYAFKPKTMVIADVIVMLRTILGREPGAAVSTVEASHMKKIAIPDLIALGHGVIDFREYRPHINHLLEELEELIRINREHII